MKQFQVIDENGQKWLRRYHPDEVIYGEPRRYTLVPYIGSRPEGTILDESEVRELTQCRLKNAPSDKWQEIGFGKVPPPSLLFEARTAYTDAESHDIHISDAKIYNYTISQFDMFRDMPEYFEEGAIVNVTNNFTGKVTTYKVETKKVFTKISKDWTD